MNTLPAGYHLSWLTRISQVCKTEPLYLAQESCSISSYHFKTKITPGNTCSQHNLARIWNSTHARESMQLALTDASAPCGQVAAGWELCFTFPHISAEFCQDVAVGRHHQQSAAKAHLSTLTKTSGHKIQQHILGWVRAGVQPNPSSVGTGFPASAKQVYRYICPYSICHIILYAICWQCTKTSASLQSYS